ncbi:cadherin-like beta sandwich domain-containing protein [Clostridium sp. BL-8]|uniref:cadherin-like beta sandwich domain-containing protein n=1 Tax=Clostridium sp. BL-8 TaxID=349938 RepID=UPI00098C07DA|nr:cadherin-like beta sandwich domain-containing protein [Clostridium sp. BL-8]OOM74538.1 toxin B [Clostridium sp. BL-8]
MGKKFKSIRTILFFAGIFCGIVLNYSNMLTIKAYAKEDDGNPHLSNIYLSEGDNIKFSEGTYSYIVDVDKDTTEAFIKAKPDDPNDIVRVNGNIVDKENYYKEDLSLSPGKNKVEIEVDDDKSANESKYTVYIFRGGKEAVYLKDIDIDGNTIGFNESNTLYNVELDDDTNVVDLETVPEDDSYSVTVNGVELDEETNSIKLKFKGIAKYTINIGVKDKDTGRVGNYILNIYLGIPVSPNVSDSINSVLKPNQWVLVNGRWRYNDSLGKPLKGTWYYDNKYNKYFHFSNMGNMQTGWIQDGGVWYYLDSKGEMQTGWLKYEDQWYYLNSKGAMQTGWAFDDGKWYYFRRDGTMIKGWIVSNDQWYYLNSSGDMRTGWMYYGKKWYFLDDSGAMHIGWLQLDDEWYYFNIDGSMKSGEWIYYNGKWYYFNLVGNMRHAITGDLNSGWLAKDNKFYYFNEDGSARTSSIIIDGYTYYFNEYGEFDYGYFNS